MKQQYGNKAESCIAYNTTEEYNKKYFTVETKSNITIHIVYI